MCTWFGLSSQPEQLGEAQPGFLPLTRRPAICFWSRFAVSNLIDDKERVRFFYKLEGEGDDSKIFSAEPIFQGEKSLEFRLKAGRARCPQASELSQSVLHLIVCDLLQMLAINRRFRYARRKRFNAESRASPERIHKLLTGLP